MPLENLTLQDRRGGASAVTPDARSVFIVDDEPMVGEVVSMVLALEGFKTRLFTSPTDALEVFQSATAKPDLLITDYVMSPLNGIDLIERCRQSVPKLPTILYTGNLTEDNLAEYRGIPDAFLNKPFLPKELIKVVQTLLARST